MLQQSVAYRLIKISETQTYLLKTYKMAMVTKAMILAISAIREVMRKGRTCRKGQKGEEIALQVACANVQPAAESERHHCCLTLSKSSTSKVKLMVGNVVFRDYRANELLDAYEEEGIDEAPEAEDITLEEQLAARARAERELNKRDRRENRHGLPGALEGMPCGHTAGPHLIFLVCHQCLVLQIVRHLLH